MSLESLGSVKARILTVAMDVGWEDGLCLRTWRRKLEPLDVGPDEEEPLFRSQAKLSVGLSSCVSIIRIYQADWAVQLVPSTADFVVGAKLTRLRCPILSVRVINSP